MAKRNPNPPLSETAQYTAQLLSMMNVGMTPAIMANMLAATAGVKALVAVAQGNPADAFKRIQDDPDAGPMVAGKETEVRKFLYAFLTECRALARIRGYEIEEPKEVQL